MATKLKHQGPQQESTGGGGNNVVALTKCTAEGCTKRAELSNFCNEHYSWFKFGLLTREGMKPSDFDKKYQSYMKHKKSAA